jgi:haloacetate dehalogenase
LAVSDRGLETPYRLIVPDLRGYGATDKAPTGYDKRTMANDIRAMMAAHARIAR